MNLELNNYRGQDFGQVTISSLDVAEMVGREHKNVLQDLRKIQYQLDELNFQPIEYLVESNYKDELNREKPCFLLTKKGCELYGTRMTGIEGTAFAIKYIERFNEMEQELQPKLPTSYKDALLALVAQVEKTEELEKTVAIQAPKVLLAESIENSSSLILVRELAKILKQAGHDTGEKRLYAWLRDNGYLIKAHGTDRNMPTQKSLDMGLFKMVESTTNNGNNIRINKTAKVTGKGQQYFVSKLVK